MKTSYLKAVALASVMVMAFTLKAQEFENYAVLFNDQKEGLLDTVLFYPNFSPTDGTLRCGYKNKEDRPKGVKGKVVKTNHIKMAYFHGKTYIGIPTEKKKSINFCRVIGFSEDDVLCANVYGNAINVFVIDRKTRRYKTRQFALRNKNRKKNVDYNLKYFKKAIEGSFKGHDEFIDIVLENIKKGRAVDHGLDYYNSGGSSDLYDSLKDLFEELSKEKWTGPADNYDRAM